jgi:hypothetical protein
LHWESVTAVACRVTEKGRRFAKTVSAQESQTMKNIFDFLQTKEGTLNEPVFESFSHWMFEGDDEANALSRIFLRWTILYIIQQADDNGPKNEDLKAFFDAYDRTDFDAFLNRVSRDATIAVAIEQTLGSDQATLYSGDNQSTYWYFMGTVIDHIERDQLFPGQPEKKTNVLKFDQKKESAPAGQPEAEGPLSDHDLQKVSGAFGVILAVLVALFMLINLMR